MAADIDKNLMKSAPWCGFKFGEQVLSLCNDHAAGTLASFIGTAVSAAIVAPLTVKTLTPIQPLRSYDRFGCVTTNAQCLARWV